MPGCRGVDKVGAYRTRSSYRTQSLPKILHNFTFTSVERPFEEAATAASPVGARRRRSLMTAPMSPGGSPGVSGSRRSGDAGSHAGSRAWNSTRSIERMHILPAAVSAPDMKVTCCCTCCSPSLLLKDLWEISWLSMNWDVTRSRACKDLREVCKPKMSQSPAGTRTVGLNLTMGRGQLQCRTYLQELTLLPVYRCKFSADRQVLR